MANTIIEASGFGQATTPEQWAGYVLEHLTNAAVVLQSGVRQIRTLQKEVHVPRITDDGSVAWLSELETITTNAPAGNELSLVPKKVGCLTVIGNETVSDSNPAVLNSVGQAMMRKVGQAVDLALLNGTGTSNQPSGVMLDDDLPTFDSDPTYSGLVSASGKVRAAGGQPDVVYLHPTDYTNLQLQSATVDGRPLIQQDAAQGPSLTVAGMRCYVTPAMTSGTALVAEADQVVVAIRNDPSVAFSSDAEFGSDGTAIRVLCRIDVGIADVNGLCSVVSTT